MGQRFRAMIEDRENVDTLLLLLRSVVYPEMHTGKVTLELNMREGKIAQVTYGLTNILAKTPARAPEGVK